MRERMCVRGGVEELCGIPTKICLQREREKRERREEIGLGVKTKID